MLASSSKERLEASHLSARLPPFHRDLEPQLRQRIAGKAKPVGALGRIEDLALHIGLVSQSLQPDLGRAALAVFAGDHGIVEEGVAAYPAEVSTAVARMVLQGTAGASIAALAVGADVFLVDAGLAGELPPHPRLFSRKVRAGTRNMAREPAMRSEEFACAFETGRHVARSLRNSGYGILALGEVGIGNTSAAAALSHCVTRRPLANVLGAGAGAPPGGIEHKLRVVDEAVRRAGPCDPLDAMREFGGYEMAAMLGAIFESVACRTVVVVDGFIATAVACVAAALEPSVRDALLFAHLSPEQGHPVLLEWLEARPLLDLGMRLGEGTGAALAIPLIRMAEGLLRTMADLPGSHPA